MRSPEAALDWLAGQVQNPTDDWYNQCERLQRTAYGLEAHYSSADLHAQSIPGAHRFGIEAPSRGDLGLYRNGSWGHIVTFTGNGWDCYTNDYGGRGRVCIADGRALVDWCGAESGYVADAWWSHENVQLTHGREDDMALSDDDVRRVAEAVRDVMVPPTGFVEDVYRDEDWGKPSSKPLGALVYNTATRLQRFEASE